MEHLRKECPMNGIALRRRSKKGGGKHNHNNNDAPGKVKEKQTATDTTTTTTTTTRDSNENEEDEGGLSYWVKLIYAMMVLYYYTMSAEFEQAMVDHRNKRQAIAQLQDTDRRILTALQFGGVILLELFITLLFINSNKKNKKKEQEHLEYARTVYLEDTLEAVRVSAFSQINLFTQVTLLHLVINSHNIYILLHRKSNSTSTRRWCI